jgi:sulfofructosephosphate aldolase
VAWDHDDAIIAAAHELGALGADLYKGEMPLRGGGSPAEMRERCAAIDAAVDSPWVILSSGVAEADFPRAIEVACEAGASGFLAGRAVWASCLGATDVNQCLAGPAVDRLDHFATIADRIVRARS